MKTLASLLIVSTVTAMILSLKVQSPIAAANSPLPTVAVTHLPPPLPTPPGAEIVEIAPSPTPISTASPIKTNPPPPAPESSVAAPVPTMTPTPAPSLPAAKGSKFLRW